MKRHFNLTISTAVLFLFIMVAPELSAQDVTREARTVSGFTGADIGGAFDVFIETGDRELVEVEIDRDLQDKVITSVTDGTLTIIGKSLRNPKKMNVYITFRDLDHLVLSGACDVKSTGTLQVNDLAIDISGAADADLIVEASSVTSDISGAATLTMAGKSESHRTQVSGAGTLRAYDLVTKNMEADISGAGNAKVHVTGHLNADISGAGDIHYKGNPETEVVNKKIAAAKYSDPSGDTTRVNVAGVKIEVVEEGHDVDIRIGNHEVYVDEEGSVKFNRRYKRKFNGHWAGFDIGLNGYVNQDLRMNFPKEYEYLDLRMEKSVVVNLHFYEQNVALTKNKKLGLVTGLGIHLPNYRFSKATHLKADSGELTGYIARDISVRKSKLSAFYVNIPLLLEWQTNSYHKKNSFHIGVGMIANARLLSWTKVYYNEQNKDFELAQYDPATGQYESVFMTTSPGYPKVKEKNDFYLQPFKFDATVRIGWGFINLWATYSVNTMFREGKGPELYPWSAGITLLNF